MTTTVPASMTAEAVTQAQLTTINANVSTLQTQKLTAGTSVAATSGTSIDFTGIPSWVKRITLVLDEVSTSGTSNMQMQIGSSSGGIETTGYRSSSNIVSNTTSGVGGSATTGFYIAGVGAAATRSGVFTFVNISGNKWIHGHQFASTDVNYSGAGGGTKTLSSTLDRVRLTTVNGTDTFDAGNVNILYE